MPESLLAVCCAAIWKEGEAEKRCCDNEVVRWWYRRV